MDGPNPRCRHKTCVVGNNLYMWAGLLKEDDPLEHNSQRKRKITSFVDIFDLKNGNWRQNPTSGTPPLGIGGYACAAADDELHYFGGYCGHAGCYHNSIHMQVEHHLTGVGNVVPHHIRGWGTDEEGILRYGEIQRWRGEHPVCSRRIRLHINLPSSAWSTV